MIKIKFPPKISDNNCMRTTICIIICNIMLLLFNFYVFFYIGRWALVKILRNNDNDFSLKKGSLAFNGVME